MSEPPGENPSDSPRRRVVGAGEVAAALAVVVAALAPFVTWWTFRSPRVRVALDGLGGNSHAEQPDLGAAHDDGGWVVLALAVALLVVLTLRLGGVVSRRALARASAVIAVADLAVIGTQAVSAWRVTGAGAPAAAFALVAGPGLWLVGLSGVFCLAAGLLARASHRQG